MLDEIIKKINRGLEALLSDSNRRYRLGLISDALLRHSKEFVLRKGKRLRPLLLVLAYEGYRRRSRHDGRLYRCAASIELLHDYMLIHDDVIDNSDLRRGKPTLHKVFDRRLKLPDRARIGAPLAIVAGDILFALAIEAFLAIDEEPRRKEEALRKLVATAAYTGAGEFIDVVFSHKDIGAMTEREIFLVYILKTARYTFECPLVMGAILAGADRREREKLSRLGLAAGQAFQIYDDLLDLFGTQKIIGKPVLTDLIESKKTLLVYKAYKNLRGPDKILFREILKRPAKTTKDLEVFRRMIVDSGSRDYCLRKMASLQKTAVENCDGLKMKTPFKKALAEIISRLSSSRVLPLIG